MLCHVVDRGRDLIGKDDRMLAVLVRVLPALGRLT
jgi:hypothetical protein